MLNVTFEFDEAAYDASAQAFLDGALRPALVRAVNDAAAAVARGIGGFLASSLDVNKRRTLTPFKSASNCS